MKPAALVIAAISAIGISSGVADPVHARRLATSVNEAAAATRDATTQSPAAETCGTNTLRSVTAALNDPNDTLRAQLKACTRPLLYLAYKWTNAAQATQYCNSDDCRAAVARLRTFPVCTWEDVPSESDDELLVAQRVYHDCA